MTGDYGREMLFVALKLLKIWEMPNAVIESASSNLRSYFKTKSSSGKS
jgi:hypothetical protein